MIVLHAIQPIKKLSNIHLSLIQFKIFGDLKCFINCTITTCCDYRLFKKVKILIPVSNRATDINYPAINKHNLFLRECIFVSYLYVYLRVCV